MTPGARIGTLLATAAVATAGYLAVSRLVAKRRTRDEDLRARATILPRVSKRAEKLAETTGHIGKWYTHVPASALGSALLAFRHRPKSAATLLGVSLGAAGLNPLLERVHAHRVPPPGKLRIDPGAQSFPSGHALETTAVAFAAAYVLSREDIVPAAIGFPVAALLAVISGAGRLALDRHWITDSAAGYLGGIALAATAAAAYEL